MTETEDLFEGHEPRECGEHRTLGSHRAWCFDCHEYCYPRIAAACNGCRNPVIEQLMDDLAEVLRENFNTTNGRFIWEEDTEVPAVVDVMARYRAYKETE
jgi:hypothetical protein